MLKDDQTVRQIHRITLFVCSGCEACYQAATFLRGWAKGCPDVTLEIVPVLQQPEQIVRLGLPTRLHW